MEKLFKYGFAIAIIIIAGLIFKSCNDDKKYDDKLVEEANLRKALADTVTHFQTKEGDWGAEKRTMQTDLKNLKDQNLNLTENQKTLVKFVEQQNKNNQVIAAAVVELRAELKGLKDDSPVATTDSTANFAKKLEGIEYDVTVSNVKPFEFKKPVLTFNKLLFPNTQTIDFHWKDNKKEGYPISFSVINTNPYFKVSNIDSYAIPELTRADVKPTFWQKIGKGSKTLGGKAVIFSVGVGVGFLAYQQIAK